MKFILAIKKPRNSENQLTGWTRVKKIALINSEFKDIPRLRRKHINRTSVCSSTDA